MTTNYAYDTLNRLTAIKHKDGTTVLDGFYYDLDAVGNITSTTHEDGAFWDYAYDGRYRLTSAVRKNPNETIAATYAYTYDSGDNLLTKVEPFEDDFNDGNYTGWAVWSGTWSASNNYLRMTPGAAATIAQNSVTDNDNELRFSYVCNDTSSGGYTLIVSPRYASSGDRVYVNILPGSVNLAQRVSGVWSSLDAKVLSSTQGVQYDIRIVCDGQSVKVYRTAPGALEQLVLQTSSCTVASTNYMSFTPSANADFSIDNVRILADGLSNTTTFAVNNANELTSMTDRNGSTTFGFDAWGRMTSKARGSYTAAYGYRYGQMLCSVDSDFPGEGDVTYEYGADSHRRTVAFGSHEVSYWWNDYYDVLREEDSLGSATRTHVDGGFATSLGSSPASGTWRYSLHDMNSIRSVRGQSAEKEDTSSFSPWGKCESSGALCSISIYSGLRGEESSDLRYGVFRYLMPHTGRWLTRDPMHMIDGTNLYAYAANNPINLSDQLGLACEFAQNPDRPLDLDDYPAIRDQIADCQAALQDVFQRIYDSLPKSDKANVSKPDDWKCKIHLEGKRNSPEQEIPHMAWWNQPSGMNFALGICPHAKLHCIVAHEFSHYMNKPKPNPTEKERITEEIRANNFMVKLFPDCAGFSFPHD